MKLDALDHPKTLDLASRLQISLPTAIGHLELLWAFAGKKATPGNVGKWPDGAIAGACHWTGDAKQFVNALADAGFLDRDRKYRLTVHDWQDHAPGWVRAKLKKTGVSFIATSEPSLVRSSERSSDDELPSSEHSSEPSLEPSIQGKGREGKSSEEKSTPTLTLNHTDTHQRGNASRSPAKATGPRATRRMPADYNTEPMQEWAIINTPFVDFDIELAKIRDHQFRDAHSDWDAVVRNWLRRAAGDFKLNGHSKSAMRKTRTAEETEHEYVVRYIAEGKTDDEIDRELDGWVTLERIRAIRAEVEHAQH